MCPPCAWVQVERWLARQKQRLLACEHYRAIFTIPHELKALWLAHVAAMTNLLCASVHDTLLELLDDRQYLGAKPGIIATLHPWSQTWLLHPHMHGLVTGGGLSTAGQWVAVRNGFLLPMRVVRALFRGKLLAAMRQGVAHGTLKPPEGKSRQQVETRLHKLGRMKWNVHIRERYPHGQGVLVYLARYLRGGPLATRRLLSCDGEQVVFRYEQRPKGPGGQAKPGTVSLPLEPFIGRWLQHVPPTGAVRVRGWGLYGHTQGAALTQCRQPRGHGPSATPVPREEPRARQGWGEAPPACCPVGGPRLVCPALRPRTGVPPPAAPGWEQVAGGAGPRPARARAAGERAGPARGAGGLLESPLGSRPLRRPAIVGPTAPAARAWSLLLAQQQERTAVHSPERTLRNRQSVRGPSHQVLKRTAAGSGVPRSIGLAAASHLFRWAAKGRLMTL
jgi:Putative transposase